MAVLAVTYDLNKPGQDYTDLLKTIRSYPYAQLSKSSYANLTTEAPQAVYLKISPCLDKNDNLFVITLSRPYSGHGPQMVDNWLAASL